MLLASRLKPEVNLRIARSLTSLPFPVFCRRHPLDRRSTARVGRAARSRSRLSTMVGRGDISGQLKSDQLKVPRTISPSTCRPPVRSTPSPTDQASRFAWRTSPGPRVRWSASRRAAPRRFGPLGPGRGSRTSAALTRSSTAIAIAAYAAHRSSCYLLNVVLRGFPDSFRAWVIRG